MLLQSLGDLTTKVHSIYYSSISSLSEIEVAADLVVLVRSMA